MKTTGTQPDIEILFEDNHLLVINKPSGVLSQEDRTATPDVLTLCKAYLKKEYGKPGNVFLGLVHRLDKPVSGVMVLAKTSKAASRLSDQVRRRKLKKTYLAIVEGSAPSNGFLDDFLLKDPNKNITRIVSRDTRGAKEARLSFQKLGEACGKSLLKVNLMTGRPHQIRVQLAGHGYPITGDSRYGSANASGICLHAREIEFSHPTLKKSIHFSGNIPKKAPWTLFKSFSEG
ncbi:RluA family pseudouridine synthase [Rhodohalobacter mucosus]|uniref:RNA pseudouridine synthase n=1 Tax=Rhodohalobacter mucosus TaxID=2079485 RepID=A0A316TVE7_9BACT|nr:RluA family pseudouridine synthase [Rhodohalobacter mucosus]PWN06442.1 RNA pseudouridine synthase [Rhodohalobacter mucosus]